MVQLNFEVDESTARRARMVKAYDDISWSEFVEEATECLAEKYGVELPDD